MPDTRGARQSGSRAKAIEWHPSRGSARGEGGMPYRVVHAHRHITPRTIVRRRHPPSPIASNLHGSRSGRGSSSIRSIPGRGPSGGGQGRGAGWKKGGREGIAHERREQLFQYVFKHRFVRPRDDPTVSLSRARRERNGQRIPRGNRRRT